MKQQYMEILSNEPIAKNVYRLRLAAKQPLSDLPGQFVNLRLNGFFLRRPISVCDEEDNVLTLIYKVVGQGTEALSGMRSGTLDLLTGLGNGYDLSPAGDRPLLIGGGVGVPPLYLLARRLLAQGKRVSVILGFNTADEVFYEREFAALGAKVTVTTVDGSHGQKGFVTAAVGAEPYSYFYTCGPEPMLRAVWKATETSGQFSFEERMGCGFGACMGCSCRTLTGNKRICREGPVLRKEEILWEK